MSLVLNNIYVCFLFSRNENHFQIISPKADVNLLVGLYDIKVSQHETDFYSSRLEMSTFVLVYFHIYFRIILILESSLELYQNMIKESLNLVMDAFCDRDNSILGISVFYKIFTCWFTELHVFIIFLFFMIKQW